MKFRLPWPPSVNTYYRHIRSGPFAGRTLISRQGREYRAECKTFTTGCLPSQPLSGRLRVSLTCYPPDNRKRDLDNLLKSMLDALQHAGAYESDEQIDDLHIVRSDMKGSAVDVQIDTIGST